MAKGSTKTSVRKGIQRHTRWSHTKGGKAKQEAARALNAKRMKAVRAEDATHAPAASYEVYITSPASREQMYDDCLGRLARAGCDVRQVRRRHGVKFGAPCARLPVKMRKSEFLMYDFHKKFLPMVEQRFAQSSNLKHIFWAEDDVTVKPGVLWRDILEAANNASPSAAWCGYFARNGRPTWGSHLLALTRASARAIGVYIDELVALADSEGRIRARAYQGLDSLLASLAAGKRRGSAKMVRATPKSLAGQKIHHLKGRRLQ